MEIVKRRRSELDALRILACLMVVMIHVIFSKWADLDVHTSRFVISNLFAGAVRPSAVPLFVMISGALFLRKSKMPSLSEIFKKYILRLLLLYLFWALFYAIDEVGVRAVFAPGGWKALISAFIQRKYHLWYLPRLMGTYALLPLFWCVTHYADGKYVRYILCACAVFLALNATLLVLPVPTMVTDALNQFEFPLNSFAPFILLGWYLTCPERRKFKTSTLILAWIGTVLCASGANYIVSVFSNTPCCGLLNSTTIFAYLQASLLFMIFENLSEAKFLQKNTALLAALSLDTLGIYLIHLFILEHLDLWFGISASLWPAWCSIPFLTLVVFLLSLGCSALLRRIPFFGKHLL